MRLLLVLVVALASAKFFKVVSTEDKSTWMLRERADGFVSFRVNFAYRNQERLDQIFNEVSDVNHANYGKYLTTVELNKLVNPSLKEKQPVYDWLSQHSCTFADVGQHAKVRCPVRRVEALLQTRLYNWVNSKNKRRDVKALQGFQVPDRYLDVLCDKHPIGGSMTVMEPPRKLGFVIDHSRLNAQGGPVTVAVVPQTLETQYAINGLTINPPYNVVTQCVAEFGNDNSYLPSDLTAFSAGMNVNIEGTVSQHGPFNPSPPDPESTLDIQYIASTGRNGSNVFWVVSGWLHEWLGDIQAAGSPPEISSISWGADERQQGASYSTGVDLQFKALNTVGCTFLAASGDTGAIGQQSCRNQYVFNPGYPATSPFVLSVGATMFDSFVNGNINSPFCQGNNGLGNCAVSGHEQPADVSQYSFSSGGGFSTYATQPTWQKDVVTRYTESHKIKLPPTKDFVKTNRGFPDVAAQGWNIIIQLGGSWSGIGGTSASSPIFAGMISLMNDHQRKRGKAKLGFINPVIYQMANATAGIFTTIGETSTNNKNGCKYGFVGSANVAGVPWNPVTGLGVINLQKALAWLDANTR